MELFKSKNVIYFCHWLNEYIEKCYIEFQYSKKLGNDYHMKLKFHKLIIVLRFADDGCITEI